MAISSETRKAGPFRSDGERTDYEFNFQVFRAEDIQVISADLDGVESEVEPYLYTVELNEDRTTGGVVKFFEPLPKNHILAILSNVDYLQQTVLTNRGGFFPEVINSALDKITVQIQQVREVVDRCLKVGAASTKGPN